MRSVHELVQEIAGLSADVAGAQVAAGAQIEAALPEHREGAVNLVHYAELRSHDLRDLQHDLMDIGVSSLATTEANVQAKLSAASAALRALDGEPGPWDLESVNAAIDAGDAALHANAEALLGPAPKGRTTRIMVTLPSEAAENPELVADLVAHGMDLARINCAHDGPAAWAAMAAHVRRAAADQGREVGVYMDLGGPKLRTGPIAPGPAVVRVKPQRDTLGRPAVPGRMWLTTESDDVESDAVAVPVDPAWLRRRQVDEVVTFTDTRGRDRGFLVVQVGADGVLAESDRTSYIVTGMTLAVGNDTTQVGPMPHVEQKVRLAADDVLILTKDLAPADPNDRPARIGCTLPEVFGAVAVGDRILFDDGEIEGVVESTTAEDVTVRVTRTKPGGKNLGAEKGINLPDTDLPVDALTEADLDALPTVVQHADIVGLSFVRSAADVARMREVLESLDAGDLGLVIKVETPQAVADLPAILLDAMRWPRIGVMIARGDLMTEIGWERMSEVPYQILSLCEAGHIPVIWATQVLESLAKNGVPSRAEIIDAAESDRAECVMLNKGPYILDAVATLDAVLGRMRRVQRKNRSLLRQIKSWS